MRRLTCLTLIAILSIPCADVRAASNDEGAPRQIARFDLMPKPALLPDGTLATYFLEHRGPGLTPTPMQQSVFARYSTDGGRTWSDPETLFDLPSEEGGFGYFVVQVDHDGEVHFFILCDAGTGILRARPEGFDGPAVEPIARQSLDVWYVRSTGNRTQWSEPRTIWKGRAGDPQSVTQLRNGRLLLPMSYYVGRSWRDRGEGFAQFTYLGQFDVTTLYSDDGGETWRQSDAVLSVPTPTLASYGAVEPVVVQLRDDLVWMLIRTQMGVFYESFSEDGATWTPAAPCAIRSSDSPAGFVRLSDNRLVLLWNNCNRYPYAQGGRRALHAAVSRDDGQTWVGYREVLLDAKRDVPPPPSGDHGVSYPFPTATADDRVIFSMWVETGEGRGLFGFDPDWLEETEHADDFTAGLDGWSTYGTRGVEVVEAEGSDDGAALRLQPAGDDWPTAAVWNFPMGTSGKLKLRVRREGAPGTPGNPEVPEAPFLLLLTDHYSSPFDEQAKLESVYGLQIGGADGAKLPAGEWTDLELAWDGESQQCRVSIGGKQAGVLSSQRRAGVCYVRLSAIDRTAGGGSLLIDAIEAEVKPPTRGDAKSLFTLTD